MEIHKILPYGKTDEKKLLQEALINTDPFGSPVETAMIKCAKERNIEIPQLEILDKFPFSSELKFSATIYAADSQKITSLLGAPERILERSALPAEEKEKILKEVDALAYAGNRVLGVASAHGEKFENLNFMGIISLKDPVRPSVKAAIKTIGENGVRTIIVTGDHKGTAEAVARELGMIDGKGAVLTGEDMAHLSDEELKNRADETAIFARVTPQDKMRLVKIFRERGETVAVTGDGINDAPAIKAADIGIAVGSGTDVAKAAADLVILDDNFETIVAAIEEGKRILANIKKVIVYLLSNSMDELFLIGGALAMGLALPLNALQILFVNFFTDSFPAIAFAFEKDAGDGKNQSRSAANIFDKKVKFLILIIGALTSALLFALYFTMLKIGVEINLTKTFIFAAFATYTLFLSFSIRSLEKGIFSYNPFSNKYLLGGVAAGLILTSAVIYIPLLQKIFNTTPLPLVWGLGVLAVGLFNIVLVELSKWFFRKNIL